MKCLVMAGGAGNRLWPLSRRDYPKQFIEIRNGHSMFQETIARNLPYCNEFIICTSKEYLPIVIGQLQVFQHLKYRCIVEEASRRTAPPTLLACSIENPSEMILFASADHIIDGNGYKDAILKAKEYMQKGKMVCLGVPPDKAVGDHGMLKARRRGVACFEKVTEQQAEVFLEDGGWLWDCGIQAFRAGDFLNEFANLNPITYHQLMDKFKDVDTSGKKIYIPASALEKIEPLGIGGAITGKSAKMVLLKCDFKWNRLMTLQSMAEYCGKAVVGDGIIEDSENVSVINYAKNHLVVVNGVKDVIVVQTDDAVYVTDYKNSQAIREIGFTQNDEYRHYFQSGRKQLYNWGEVDFLLKEKGYSVRKATIYPLRAVTFGAPDGAYKFKIMVISGTLKLQTKQDMAQFNTGDYIEVNRDEKYQIINSGNDDLLLMEIAWFSCEVREDPGIEENDLEIRPEAIIRLNPVFKDYIWGGTKLRTKFHKNCDYDRIAESWELSMHRAGQSTIGSGICEGMLLGEYLHLIGKQSLGWKSVAFDRFPLLIKFIDAHDDLSIQVHPNDDYALLKEDDYGKCEMWHIIECENSSYIYYGFNRDVTPEEVRRRTTDGTLLEVLNKVKVSKGQNIMIEAGVVHAIGKGILLCEIQQSSNVTYRLYDYNRRDVYGNLRELHLEKAMDVMRYEKLQYEENVVDLDNNVCESKYFSVSKRHCNDQMILLGDDASFTALTFIDGNGIVAVDTTVLSYSSGDTFFVPAGKCKITISGKGTFLHVRL